MRRGQVVFQQWQIVPLQHRQIAVAHHARQSHQVAAGSQRFDCERSAQPVARHDHPGPLAQPLQNLVQADVWSASPVSCDTNKGSFLLPSRPLR